MFLGEEVHTIGVIKANPEQSKHLEAASMKLQGIWVDFVNLRSNSFGHPEEDSIMIGTPLEDALHRDLTINSLFYNINNDRIEDWCGTGLEDLRNELIRTPLPPMQTFMDDPLRVLRAIRFATLCNFQISPSIVEASKSPEIKERLSNNVSRERIGKEVAGMLKTNHPEKALNYISEFNLIDVVFKFPESVEMKESDSCKCMVYANKLVKFLSLVNTPLPADTKQILLLSSFLIPFSGSKYKVRSKEFPVCMHIFIESLKYTKKETDTALTLLNTFKMWQPFINTIKSNKQLLLSDRKEVGLIMRETKQLWLASIIMAILDEIDENNEISQAIQIWVQLTKCIEDLQLIGVWELKPFFDGHQVKEMLDLKEGAIIGKIMNQQLCWQLQNPDKTQLECQLWLKQEKF